MIGPARPLAVSLLATVLALVRPAAAAEEAPFTLNMGVLLTDYGEYSRSDLEISLRFWVEEVSRDYGVPSNSHFYTDADLMQRDFAAGRIDMITLSAVAAVRHFPIEELSAGITATAEQPDHLLLVVRKGTGIAKLGDLAGKRMVVIRNDPTSLLYLETLSLRAFGERGEGALAAVNEEKRPSLVINQLFFGRAEVALVYRNSLTTAIDLNPQVGERLQVLDEYTLPLRCRNLSYLSKRLEEADRDRIIQASLRVMNHPRGRQILQLFNAERVSVATPEDLLPVRRLLQENLSLRTRYPRAQLRALPR